MTTRKKAQLLALVDQLLREVEKDYVASPSVEKTSDLNRMRLVQATVTELIKRCPNQSVN